MKPKSQAKKIVAGDGIEVFYWVTWKSGMNSNFHVLHPGASMNHSALERLEKGLNDRGYPTIVFDPRGFGHSKAPARKRYYRLENYTNDIADIIQKEGLEKTNLIVP